MNADEHLGEDAALYALGALDDRSRRTVDEHAAHCSACAQLLGAAENDVAQMALAQGEEPVPAALDRRIERLFAPSDVVELRPRSRPRPFWQPAIAAAVAAALIVGILPAAYFWREDAAMHRTMAADAEAMNRLASTPHRTVAFAGMNPGADAHVMYGRDGSWYVVLVRGASRAVQVVWMHDGERTMLGTAQPHGDVALLYLPKSHRMDTLALMDGERVVGEAQLAY